jgi:hypothetical protein
MIFTYATTPTTPSASLFLVRMFVPTTSVSRWFGLVSYIGDDPEREFDVVSYDTKANVAECGPRRALDGPRADLTTSLGWCSSPQTRGKGDVDTDAGTETVGPLCR